MVMEKLQHRAGCGAAEGKIIAITPLAPGQFDQRCQRKGVNRAFGYGQPGTFRISSRQREIIPLVAALHVQTKVVPRSPQAGEPGAALCVPADKNAVLITAALLESAGLDTRLKQIRVDTPALQIG